MAHLIKRYGIKRRHDGRYNIITDISEDKKQYREHHELNYSKAEFALIKACQFQTAISHEFTDSRGEKWTFELENIGLLPSTNH